MQEGGGEKLRIGKVKSNKVADGIKDIKEVHRQHKLQILASQNKTLKKRLKQVGAPSESDSLSVDGIVTSHTDTTESNMATGSSVDLEMYGHEEWPEPEHITVEKKKQGYNKLTHKRPNKPLSIIWTSSRKAS